MAARTAPMRLALLRRHTLAAAFAMLAVIALVSTGAVAKDLRVTLAIEPTSIDPHFQLASANTAFATHLFDRLVHMNETQQLAPGLALSWAAVDPLTWEFKLRPGVTFHDGSPFTADDVVFSLGRAVDVAGSPAGFGLYLRGKTVRKVDDLTVRISTATPYPLMAHDLATIAIVSKKYGSTATTADYNTGKAAIGTGPYKFAVFVPGERIEVTANPAYWGAKPAWDRVVLRPVRSGPARVAALLAGDTDVIEDVPTTDIAKLKTDPRVAVTQTVSYRVVFLQLDQWRETTPFANAKDGGAIKNPFRTAKVRRAIAHAINREGLVGRVMEGHALPAAQLLPEGFGGLSQAAKVQSYDPEKAKRLLAEAGFPTGFKVTMHGPSGRYPSDTRVLEAIAQMLGKIGIEASIETMAPTTFFTRASTGADGQPEFSLFLAGWGAVTGENASPLRSLLATFDKATGIGASNRGRYSSKAFDEALDAALTTLDPEQVKAGLAKATDIALGETAIIPLLHPLNSWASRKGFVVQGRADEATTAMTIRAE